MNDDEDDPERVEKISTHAVNINQRAYLQKYCLPACSRNAAKVGPDMPALRRCAPADRNIIEHKTERHQRPTEDGPIIDHPNIRGSQYFH